MMKNKNNPGPEDLHALVLEGLDEAGPEDLHALVLEGLDEAGDEGRLAEVALESGVPYNTCCKLRQRRHPNPGVETCIKLYRAMYH